MNKTPDKENPDNERQADEAQSIEVLERQVFPEDFQVGTTGAPARGMAELPMRPAVLTELPVKMLFPGEPAQRWTLAAFDDLLRWAKRSKASDIKLVSRGPVWAKIFGEWKAVTRRGVQTNEIVEILHGLTRGQVAYSRLVSGADWDMAYEVKEGEEGGRIRFRGNATACRDGWSRGIVITLRLNADRPPSIEEIELPEVIVKAASPQNGLILFSGVMGSGKTTSIAALLAYFNTHFPWSIATYEQPIEFDLTNLPGALGPVVQSEVPFHFRGRSQDPRDESSGFRDAPRNAARRAEDAILVGESRDAETLDSMVRAAELGTRVYSTVHTLSVASALIRIINEFSPERRNQITAALLGALRLVVQQRLVTRIDPATGEQKGRIALREHLEFDAGMRDHLMSVPISSLTSEVEKLVRAHGRPLIEDTEEKHRAGLVSDLILHGVQREYADSLAETKIAVPADLEPVELPSEDAATAPDGPVMRFLKRILKRFNELLSRQDDLERRLSALESSRGDSA